MNAVSFQSLIDPAKLVFLILQKLRGGRYPSYVVRIAYFYIFNFFVYYRSKNIALGRRECQTCPRVSQSTFLNHAPASKVLVWSETDFTTKWPKNKS